MQLYYIMAMHLDEVVYYVSDYQYTYYCSSFKQLFLAMCQTNNSSNLQTAGSKSVQNYLGEI